MTSQELRFSLAERKPSGIKSQGGVSGEKVLLEDEGSIRDTINKIHSAKVEQHDKEVDWICLTYTGPDVKTLKMLGSGKGGLKALQGLDLPEGSVAYILLRVLDDNDGVLTTRFVYMTWIGDKVSGITNARIGVKKTAVTDIIGHYSVEILISNKNDLNDENIVGKVQYSSGSRSRVKDQMVVDNNNLTKSKAKIVPSNAIGSMVPKEQKPIIRIVDQDASKSLVQTIRIGNTPTNWMLLKYNSKANNELVVGAKGTNGLSELKSQLQDNEAAYIFLSVSEKIDQTTMSRFIYIRWMPEGIPSLVRGKLTPHRGFVEDWFQPYHLSINASSQDELCEKVITDKLHHMSGH